MRTFVALLAVAGACAQSGLVQPRLGAMLDAHGVLWPVSGIPGSFVIKDPLARGVLSMACTAQLCLAKTQLGMLVNGRFRAEAPGPAVVAVDGADAWLYLARTRELMRWHQGSLTPMPSDIDGEVLSIGPGPALAVRRITGIWIVNSAGVILDALPAEARGAVVLTAGATVYATADSLVLRRSGGREVRFPAAGVTALWQMSDDLVEARAGAVSYALVTDPGRERLWQLPQPVEALHR